MLGFRSFSLTYPFTGVFSIVTANLYLQSYMSYQRLRCDRFAMQRCAML